MVFHAKIWKPQYNDFSSFLGARTGRVSFDCWSDDTHCYLAVSKMVALIYHWVDNKISSVLEYSPSEQMGSVHVAVAPFLSHWKGIIVVLDYRYVQL